MALIIGVSKKIFKIAGMFNMVCCFFTGLSLLLLNNNAFNNNVNVATLERAFPLLARTAPWALVQKLPSP